jgi:thiosulfate/3-mercaptopyruvate sulfurtransferase
VIPPVVDADFVADHPEAVLVDVRWYLDGRDGFAAYRDAHLPGARWVDLETGLAAHGLPATEGRHPLPTPQVFAQAMSELGISDDSVVVAYDDTGGITAGRLVFMLRVLGVDAALLDGGLTAWTGPVEAGVGQPPDKPGTFTDRPWPAERFVSADEAAAAAAEGHPVIDARSYDRFTGAVTMVDKTPGHIPGARSAPATDVFAGDGRFKPVDALRAHYAARGIDESSDVIASCGSGVSACVNILALEHAGLAAARLYVGSWSGWSADPARPVELGPGATDPGEGEPGAAETGEGAGPTSSDRRVSEPGEAGGPASSVRA